MNKKLIVYGIGKYAEYVGYAFQEDSDYDVIGFCVEDPLHNTETLFSKPLFRLSELKNKFYEEEFYIFLAVGNNEIRTKIFESLLGEGFKFAHYISSNTRRWNNLKIGQNTFIDEGCVLQAFVEIEDNCILFTTDLGHHTKICKNSLLSGAKTGGNVTIGEKSYVGLNASIKQNIKIGENNLIGMNCAIERDTENNSVFTNKGTVKRKIDASVLGNRFLR